MSHSLSIAVSLLLLVTGVQAVHPGATATQELSKQAIGYKTSPDNYHILYRSTSLEGAWRPIRMKLGGDGPEDVMRDTVPIKHRAFYRVLSLPLDEPRDTDADGLTDVEELELSKTQHPLNAAIVAESHGAAIITSREQYERLARRDSVPGASNIREMKFLITDIDTNSPKLHLIDTTRHQFHVYFYWFALGNRHVSISTFNSQTYFTNTNRKNLAGSILAHDNFTGTDGQVGLYTMEFWPTDPVAFRFVETAYEMLSASLPFIDGTLAYHPAGETQRTVYADEVDRFESSMIRTISTEELFGSKTFEALNPGVSFGRLIVADGVNNSLTARDIVIFRNLPNDLTHVAGILTEVPQTPLSHVNLKAKQNDTPNAYLKDASRLPEIQELLGKYILFEITSDGYTLREATAEQVEQFIESIRPKESQIPELDLSAEAIKPLGEIDFSQSPQFGAKAANLSELRRILPADMTPEGQAIPFSFYHRFMLANSFYDILVRMLAIQGFAQDADLREAELAKFRKRLRQAPMPNDLSAEIALLHSSFPTDTALRCRSSTNNEDLPGFNGAGLYDSYTHYPHEGSLEESIKQVWASMWNYRAFEERDFYRISHFHAAMGVIVHPNYQDEICNGVAVTRNIIDPNWIGYYVNVQVGEDLVTNPTEDAIPEEFLVSLLLADPEIGNYEYEVQYVRKSNRRVDGQPILAQDQVFDLAGRMRLIQTHFKRLYNEDNDFGMEIEFKIDQSGQLVIKQARPWID
ncbi:MAG: hypothetical protein GWQ08_22895 [Verrucomicrobiaceae bacterium]|nr:hypothetical protein [Verrucomicrobiaceae bacterium]